MVSHGQKMRENVFTNNEHNIREHIFLGQSSVDTEI